MTTYRGPGSSQVVVIGGGIIGCSTAYHLAKLGCEVLLLERNKLSSGSTFHAAGLVGQLRTSANITELLGYSVELYNSLETETGLGTGWKMNGGLRLACNDARWFEVQRQAMTARSFGLDVQLLSPSEAQQLWPLMTTADVIGAAFLPTDGQANPSDITQALAKGARKQGGLIIEDTQVLDINIENGVIQSVVVQAVGSQESMTVACEKVVCCCGQWTREFAGRFGVNVPLVSVQHQYLVTDKINSVTDTLPTLRDPDRLTYFKEEVGGLVMGGYEPKPKPWAVNGIPNGFHFSLLDSDFDHFAPMLEHARTRVPALDNAGVKQLINGPESFTPDGNFILGEAPELNNFFIGAGFNAFGIASGGGAGMALAEWVNNGAPPFDLWTVDIRRFGVPHRDTAWVRDRTMESYAKHYAIAWPEEEYTSARPKRRSPLYDILKKQGACFGEKLGWERPNWFASGDEKPVDVYSFSHPAWSQAVAREHHAIRNACVLIDQSSFAKFIVEGADSMAALSWLCANDISKPIGSVTYTQLLNTSGGIECDLTVARLEEHKFYLVTGTGFATHDFHWIKSNISPDKKVTLSEVTTAYAVLSVMGPLSRQVLSDVTTDSLCNKSFPFSSVRKINIAGCEVTALRVSYVGELGWELHIPVEYAVTVYETLVQCGTRHGLVNAGYRAIESCRLEKGYLAWGKDIGPDNTPYEAGLSWAVKLNKAGSFIGRDLLYSQRRSELTRKLVYFTISDPNVVLLGRETIYRNGEKVGWLSSGGFGFHINRGIGIGYIRNSDGLSDAFIEQGSYQLDVASTLVDCFVHRQPLYDPKMKRVRL